ncbi:MAG: hypothetical protein HY724_12225 [Candidatus Rokubacteria bacterium]|nr:hypothetical protein [Candidatus Rokubacteria bacterium]
MTLQSSILPEALGQGVKLGIEMARARGQVAAVRAAAPDRMHIPGHRFRITREPRYAGAKP